jgi:hypothetical protein
LKVGAGAETNSFGSATLGGTAHQDLEEADGSCGDEEKLRADSPAMSDYILKNCKRVWGEKTDCGFTGTRIWEPLITRKWAMA